MGVEVGVIVGVGVGEVGQFITLKNSQPTESTILIIIGVIPS